MSLEEKILSECIVTLDGSAKDIMKKLHVSESSVYDVIIKIAQLSKKDFEKSKENNTLASDNEWAMRHKYSYEEVKDELPYKTNSKMKP